MKAHSEVLAFLRPRLMIARRVPCGVVVDRPEIVPHELGHLERLADETPFRQMEMSLAPGDIQLGAGQLALPSVPVFPRRRAARLDRARPAAVAARVPRHRPEA